MYSTNGHTMESSVVESERNVKRKAARQSKRACEFCKARHLKCDGNEPCYQCDRRGKECLFVSDQPKDSQSPSPNTYTHRPEPDEMLALHGPITKQRKRNLPDDVVGSPNAFDDSPNFSGRDRLDSPSTTSSVHQQDSPTSPSSSSSNHMSPPFIMPNDTGSPRQSLPPQPTSLSTHVDSANHWLVAYVKAVSPFSSTKFTIQDVTELQRIITADTLKLCSVDAKVLCKAFIECTMVAHGSRYCANVALAHKYADKASEILRVLLGPKRAQNVPHLAQSLCGGLELLVYFMIGSDDFVRCRHLLAEAYRILVAHKTSISDPTRHRILGLQVGASGEMDDMNFWLTKAKSLNLSADSVFESSGWVVLALMLVGAPIFNGDKSLLPANNPLSPTEFQFRLSMISFLDECHKAVHYFEHTPQGRAADSAPLTAVYRAILDGCRSSVLWQCGYTQEAVSYAAKILSSGRSTPICKLPFLMAMSYACQVCKHTNNSTLLTQGLRVLEPEAVMYPVIRRTLEELRKPLSPASTVPTPPSPMSPNAMTNPEVWDSVAASTLFSHVQPPRQQAQKFYPYVTHRSTSFSPDQMSAGVIPPSPGVSSSESFGTQSASFQPPSASSALPATPSALQLSSGTIAPPVPFDDEGMLLQSQLDPFWPY